MRIIFYLITIILISTSIFSCSKGDLVNDPQFGKISIAAVVTEDINVVQGDDHKFTANGAEFDIISGKNRFRFYTKQRLLLDTLFSVKPYQRSSFVIFKQNADSGLRVFDYDLNGFNKEAIPDSGFVKFSLVNLSKTLPRKVDAYINTTTYTPNSDKPIQVGKFLSVTSSFSAFQNIMIGKSQSSAQVNMFTLVIKDPVTENVLATVPLTLPFLAAGINGQFISSIYIIYLDDNGAASILMSK